MAYFSPIFVFRNILPLFLYIREVFKWAAILVLFEILEQVAHEWKHSTYQVHPEVVCSMFSLLVSGDKNSARPSNALYWEVARPLKSKHAPADMYHKAASWPKIAFRKQTEVHWYGFIVVSFSWLSQV